MRQLFAHRTSPVSKSSPLSTFKKHLRAKLRIICAVTYFFICFAFFFSSPFPNTVFTYSPEHTFRVTTGDAPVLNHTGHLKFSNTPISSLRPQNQFLSPSRSKAPTEPPILTVITVTRNARDVIRYTARFILEQSLLPIRWLIVNDHTDLNKSYKLLQQIASLDSRFELVNSTRQPGFSNGRIYALNTLLQAPTKYFAFLDDDDFFEYTAYEKCIWMLESNFNASMCGSYIVGFGERNYTWEYGFHDGYKVIVNNPLTGSELLRTSVLSTDCGFDESLKSGMEDWDFYLCLASRGLWGITVPEYLSWYRINPESMRKKRWGSLYQAREQTSKEIRERYKELEHHFPRVNIHSTTEFEAINFSLPLKNELFLQKTVLMIIPWMSNGNADIANLRLVQEFSLKGYRVTVVCTLLNLRGTSTMSRPLFMQYTHDIFTIPGIIRLADAPRFLDYLIRSRNVQTVLISNSQLGYGVLPWLSARFPDVTFTDFVHSVESDWKNGGYATLSRIHETSLDATFTSSASVRQYMIQEGHGTTPIESGNFGMNLNGLHPLQDEKQAAARIALGIPAEAIVVVFLARTVVFRQAKLATAAFLQVAKDTGEKGAEKMASKLRFLTIGDGPAMDEAKRISQPLGKVVTFLGNLRHSEAFKYLELADIFCLSSPSNLVSFVLSESRKLGLAALTSTIGGYPEMLVQNASREIIVKHSGRYQEDIMALTKVLKKTVHQVRSRKELEQRASSLGPYRRGSSDRLSEFVDRFLAVKRTRTLSRGEHAGLSSLHYTILSILKDVGVLSDFPEIHKTMQGKDHGTYGTKYRAVCGRRDDSSARLIDLLENPKPCLEGEELDIKKLRNASIVQCYRWCIMDLDDLNFQSGWQAKENCQGFDTFNDPDHTCSTWYKSLPLEKRMVYENELPIL